ncbi:hypothetical protein I7I48_06976 [Histoplasma ohiense]|nr:hypothetical protein I7I48_06976 [Histoplasma ohiense (nom. inval.)]
MWRAFATNKKEFLCDRLSSIPIRDSKSLHSAIAIGDLSKLARCSRGKYVNLGTIQILAAYHRFLHTKAVSCQIPFGFGFASVKISISTLLPISSLVPVISFSTCMHCKSLQQ